MAVLVRPGWLVIVLVLVLVLAACNRSGGAAPPEAERAPQPPIAVAPPSPPDAAVVPPPEATFVVAPFAFRAGTSTTITLETALDLDLNFGGVVITTSSKQSKRKKVSVLSVDPDGTVHKRIHYIKRETRIVQDGLLHRDDTPIHGKTFLVAWHDGVTSVRRPDGTPATADEDKAVRSEEAQFGAPEVFANALANRRLVEGQPFEIPAALLERLMSIEDYRARRVVLVYRGPAPGGERIDVDATLANVGKGTKYYLDMKAELVVDRTGWYLEAKVKATVRAELNGAVVGSGGGNSVVTATAPS